MSAGRKFIWDAPTDAITSRLIDVELELERLESRADMYRRMAQIPSRELMQQIRKLRGELAELEHQRRQAEREAMGGV